MYFLKPVNILAVNRCRLFVVAALVSEGDGADNRTGQGETTQERHLKNHLVGGIPHLFVHVKSLYFLKPVNILAVNRCRLFVVAALVTFWGTSSSEGT